MLLNKIKQSLLNLPRFVKRVLVICCDVFTCALSVWLAFGLRLDQWGWENQANRWLILAAALCFYFPLFIYLGLYRAIFRYAGLAELASIARIFIACSFLFFSLFTLAGVDEIPRSIGVIQPLLFFIGIYISRYSIRRCLGGGVKPRGRKFIVKPVALIFGAGSAGRQLAAALAINHEMLVKGFIDDDPLLQGNIINNIEVHSSDDIQNLIHELGITDVLLAIPSATQARRNEVISALDGAGVRVQTLPGLLDMASGRVRMADLHDLDMNDLLGGK